MGNGALGPRKSLQELRVMQRKNNPARLPVGDLTGRCRHCGSQDIWDDCTAYGCNQCGSFNLVGSLQSVRRTA
jgi:hypothetical protein